MISLISSQSGQLKAAGYLNESLPTSVLKTHPNVHLFNYQGNGGYGVEFSWHYKFFFNAIFMALEGPKNGPTVHSDFEQVGDILEKCISKSHN